MEIVEIKVEDLKPYKQNTKKHDDRQVDNIALSIDKYDWSQPVVVDKNNVIIIGHGRVLAAKKLGIESVPCLVRDDLTEEQARELRIIDNKTNESDWDGENLALEFEDIDLSDFMLDFSSAFGVDINAGTNFKEQEDVDFDEVEEKAKQKRHICPCCGFEFED